MEKRSAILLTIWVLLLAATYGTIIYCGNDVIIYNQETTAAIIIGKDGGIPFYITGYAFALVGVILFISIVIADYKETKGGINDDMA